MNFKGFTLIEMIIVAVILVVLAFTVLVAINPAGKVKVVEVDSISRKHGCTELGIEMIEYFQNGTVREVRCK